MTLYYIKQDNTIWGCGEPGCCGEWEERIESAFVNCECGISELEMTGEHLQGCNGGGPVLKWRKAKPKEADAWLAGNSEGYAKGWVKAVQRENK